MQIPSITLRSPAHDDAKIQVSAEVAHLNTPFSGILSSSRGDEYKVTKNIIELLGKNTPDLTLAQSTNLLSLTAEAYEDYWRVNSLKTISGQDFTIEDEKKRLLDWLRPRNGGVYLDAGCSTALYARTIAASAPFSATVALDFAIPMLKKAREKAIADKTDIYLLQANAESLPFFSGTFDGVACGGSLNEFRDPVRAMYEFNRVLKKDGVLFLMYLQKADSFFGGVLQKVTGIGGVSFWQSGEISALFDRTGFEITRRDSIGVVGFALLRRA